MGKIKGIEDEGTGDLRWRISLSGLEHGGKQHGYNFFARMQYLKSKDGRRDDIAVSANIQNAVSQSRGYTFGDENSDTKIATDEMERIVITQGYINSFQAILRQLKRKGVVWLGVADANTMAIAQWDIDMDYLAAEGEIREEEITNDGIYSLYDGQLRDFANKAISRMGGSRVYKEGEKRDNARGAPRKAPSLSDFQSKDAEYEPKAAFWIELSELDFDKPDIMFAADKDKGASANPQYSEGLRKLQETGDRITRQLEEIRMRVEEAVREREQADKAKAAKTGLFED